MKISPLSIFPPPSSEPGRNALHRLTEEHGAVCLKLSTEDAAMSFAQIDSWCRLSEGILPVIVKIGGPNARNDIKQLLSLPVEGLIAPMVESSYGLENFIEAMKSFTNPGQYARVKKHINIETVTGLNQLQEILNSAWAGDLDEITIGCSDLSQSMKSKVDDPEVLKRVTHAVGSIQSHGIPVSIGGGISPRTINSILDQIHPNKFNTRIVTFDAHRLESRINAVGAALEFEILMLTLDCDNGFISEEEAQSRVQQLKKRLP